MGSMVMFVQLKDEQGYLYPWMTDWFCLMRQGTLTQHAECRMGTVLQHVIIFNSRNVEAAHYGLGDN